MTLTRSIGILVAMGVPALVGSGFTWALTGSWTAIYIFLAILAFTALGFIDAARK